MFAKAALWLAADNGVEALARAMHTIAKGTAQTKLELNFSGCKQISDISCIGEGLQKLTNLQHLEMGLSSEQLCGQEVLSGVLEGMFGEGIDNNSNHIIYRQTHTVAKQEVAVAAAAEMDEAATNGLQAEPSHKVKRNQ